VLIRILGASPHRLLQDAAWVLPSSSPLKCTTPAEVYLLLKSSDFISHDLSPETVFKHCESPSMVSSLEDPSVSADYELELVLRKWYPIDRGREFRCFVRQEILLGAGSLIEN
jgi:D123